MREAMIIIDAVTIRKTIIETLEKAATRVKREHQESATSLGVDLDFRFGRVWVALNDDDDSSFRCPYIADFTERNWAAAYIRELVHLDGQLAGLDTPDNEPQVEISDGESRDLLQSIEDVCRCLYPKSVTWITDWFAKRPAAEWKPIWLKIEERTIGADEFRRIDPNREPPPSSAWADEPLTLRGFPPPERGLKVFQLGYRARKYIQLEPVDWKSVPNFTGEPFAGRIPVPCAVKADPPSVRFGDLARFRTTLAFLQSGKSAGVLDSFFGGDVEKVLLSAGKWCWTAVHPLKPVSVLDLDRTCFSGGVPAGSPRTLEIAEFDADALRQSARLFFKLREVPFSGPYFLEGSAEPGFVSFCESKRLRGVEFALVWCEDISGIVRIFDEFMDLLKFRLERLTGSSSIAHFDGVECLYGVQKDFWRIGAFRELFNSSGAEEALRQLPGISVLIRSLIPFAPFRYPEVKNPISRDAIRAIEAKFDGKEILNEVTGRLCCHLPRAFALLKEMEETNTGQDAILGPSL
jgi:hypothetical protein